MIPQQKLFPVYDVPTAKEGILRRLPVGDTKISPTLAAGIQRVFGKALTPEEAVQRILGDVRRAGDQAIIEWTNKIDGLKLDELRVPQEQIEAAYRALDADLRDALHLSAKRIRQFHQKQPGQSWLDWREDGGALGQIIRPLERVGVYAPGGTAPYPSTLLMCAVPARVAGVKEVVVATPAGKDAQIAPALLAAAKIAKVDTVYRIGGAQAIGALAYGTQSIKKVDKIVGPGNIFVVTAKRQVYGLVDIDGLPGPTETLVIADAAADPALVAADLLAQAEHDTQSAAILITPSADLVQTVQREIHRQIETLSRADIIVESMQNQGGAVRCADLDEAIALNNLYAPEHLCLHVSNPWELVGKVENAGGIFLGEHTYEVLGDYTAGPTHVMPTMGTARFASPLSARDFTKIISVFSLSQAEARAISPAAHRLAQAEGLTAHANAVEKRRAFDVD
ncbi:MAG TPA: histidinol dehydrogenase [Chloroflexi bacterium]|nr:histidinol dehydrogenase [Chloroflexota bacterium]